MRRLLHLLLGMTFCSLGAFTDVGRSTSDNTIPGEIIVRFRSEAILQDVLEDLNGQWGGSIQLKRMLSSAYHIVLLGFDHERISAAKLLEDLLRHPQVMAAEPNALIEFRGVPNDPFFDRQWGLTRIGLPVVWDVTSGGLTANGDTIVIAILDSGFDITHEDLRDNVWYNRFEIPNDGIDNDQNGLVDDIAGWNFADNSPVHALSAHGHAVAGIAGARGNNGIGICGVNQYVRLMLFTIRTQDNIVAAYDYIIEQRRRYNQTRGAAGAFVVATNASFGQARVFCQQRPVWGGMYDLMGEVGILTGAGTVNSNYNVDTEGDMPASCPSEFIIATLNTNEEDRKHQTSGFGKQFIDLGTPGEGSFSIALNNQYSGFGGNSAAAPHLTGAIALLYSLPCPALATEAIEHPAQTALLIRQAILGGVDPLPNLSEYTATGGRLNVLRSMEYIQAQCAPPPGPLELLRIYPSPASDVVYVAYQAPDYEPHYRLTIFDILGRKVWSKTVQPPRFGSRIEQVNVRHWPAGAYTAVLEQGRAHAVRRFAVGPQKK